MHLVPVQKHRAPTQQIAFKPTVFFLKPLNLNSLRRNRKKSASQLSDILFGGDGELSPSWVNAHFSGLWIRPSV